MSKKISALPTYSDPLSSVAYAPVVIDGSTYKFDLNEIGSNVDGLDISPNSVTVVDGIETNKISSSSDPLNFIIEDKTKAQIATDAFRIANEITLLNNRELLVSVNTSNGTLTTSEDHGWKSGNIVFINASSYPSGFSADTRYYVRDVTSTTFKLSSTSGGSAIVPSTTGTNVIITSNNKIKRPGNLINGAGNYISSYDGGAGSQYGCGITIFGNNNTFSSLGANDANVNHADQRSFVFGSSNTVKGGFGDIFVFGYLQSVQGGYSNTFSSFGDEHLGGSSGGFFKGGFHSLMNSVGTTDLGSSGAATGSVGSGTALTGAGGICINISGSGAHGYWQGFETYQGHANKDKATHTGTLCFNSNQFLGPLSNGGTRTNELFTMLFPPRSYCVASTGVNTGTDTFTAAIALSNDTTVRVTATEAIPGGLSLDTTYYVVNSSGSTFKLSLTQGGAAVNITSTGTGIIHFIDPDGRTKWLRLFPNKIYNFEFNCIALLSSATTPTYAIMKRRASYYQAAVGVAPTLIGSIQTIGTDVGSNAGSIPAGWSLNITTATDGIHVSITVVNNDGSAREVHANCKVECIEINTQ